MSQGKRTKDRQASRYCKQCHKDKGRFDDKICDDCMEKNKEWFK